jgi:hypothetical protein
LFVRCYGDIDIEVVGWETEGRHVMLTARERYTCPVRVSSGGGGGGHVLGSVGHRPCGVGGGGGGSQPHDHVCAVGGLDCHLWAGGRGQATSGDRKQ